MKRGTSTTLGIDVGGTKTAAGVIVLPEGRILLSRTIQTRAERGGGPVLEDVLALSLALGSETASLGMPLDRIGLGLCELVSPDGRILSSNCVPWENQPVLERLRNQAPAFLEADVRAAARAEAMFGAGKACRIFLYVTIGTGISSCLVMDGQPFKGARGATGTLASSPWITSCQLCGHSSVLSLEDLAAGPGLVARFNRSGHRDATQAQEVLAAASTGDASAMAIVTSAAESLGSAIGLLVNVLDPESVILGGGLGLSAGPYWERLIQSARRQIWSEVHRGLPILRAATGVDAGWIGAAIAAWRGEEGPTQ